MLPDEIISEILSPALKVSEELFSDTSDVSPFSNYTPSTSDYLLVCKDWLRVATPLLYNVVVLRSKAQANALQQVLKTNPEFGLFIKKLRVEGGFGTAMHTILKSAPNITDLFISLSIYSSDGTGGLCKGLHLVNPHRIILVDPNVVRPLKNKQLDALKTALFDCIRSWCNLRIFGYPDIGRYYNLAEWAEKATELSQLLAQTQVHTVTFDSLDSIPHWISTLYSIPSLKVLRFQRPLGDKLVSEIESDTQLKKLAKYTRVHKPTHMEPDIAPSLNPFFVPLQSASEEIRETVWRRVLFFAMYTEEMRSPTFSRRTSELYPSRIPVLCVSKYFHRLALPYLLESLRLSFNITGLAQLLEKEPHLGSFIRRIFTAVIPTRSPIYKQAILVVFRHIPCLEVLAPVADSQLSITIELFDELGKIAGHSIQKLSVFLYDTDSDISLSSLQRFTNLHVLDTGGDIRLSGEVSRGTFNVLNTVQDLRIRESILIELFINIRLGSLRTLVLPWTLNGKHAVEDLISVHGQKLHHLTLGPLQAGSPVLDFCPNLTYIKLLDQDDLGKLTPGSQHHALVKISSAGLPKNADPEEVRVMLDMYPNLREIELRQFKWPTTEREISRSNVVPLAESLLLKNIKVFDEEGRQWIPRLKTGNRAFTAVHNALCLEREKFQQTLADYKYPVLTLPTEVTSEIFTRCLLPWPQRPEFKGPHSPSFLLRICRQWRDVALGTPELWSTMRLDIKAHIGPRLRADQLRSLKSWLQRSGDCPLSIDAILRHASRWQALEICLPLHNLRSIKGSRPLLRSLTMGTNRLSLLTFFNPFYITLPWSQITSVTAGLYVYEAAEIMRNAGALETLTVVVHGVDGPIPPISAIPPLPSLHTLILSPSGRADESMGMSALFDALILPGLRFLSTHESFLGRDSVAAISALRPTGYLLRIRIFAASASRGVYQKAFPHTQFVVEEIGEEDDSD
ncbi:hypothetical protein FB45DRAFT_1050857 [Roridomyces roridus]|uniref:F-box domain-containing protein n=1 Tax=Roridomyces roridus TaxID=1738132 RepID=A0AAD7CKZ6_9AGAR|nr:hypothetical protein FB45DRAFT_1050857 [Roridomyces roridus]